MKDFNSMIYDEIVSQKSWMLFDDESEGSLYCTAQYLRTGNFEQIVPKNDIKRLLSSLHYRPWIQGWVEILKYTNGI